MSAFSQLPPDLPMADVEVLCREAFAIDGTATPLVSERDQNARIQGASGAYVLKIANVAEDPGFIDLQNATLRHLEERGMPGIPRLVTTTAGEDCLRLARGGQAHLVRLVSWIGGTPLASAPRSLPQLAALGRYMGRLSRDLQGFGHPAAFRSTFVWSLDHVAGLRPWTADIGDPGRRALIEGLFERHASRVAPRLGGLRASVLHQDANDNNVIVAADDPESVAGLIDFGDMCFGRTVNELAITLAYALLDAPDLYAAARAVIAGYVAEFALAEDEADVLYDLMRMRLAASVCISSHQSRLHPDNAYLLISQEPAFRLLERLDSIDPEFMVALFRRAAGFAATRHETTIRAFLAGTEPSLLFRPELATAARIALPTGGERPDMPAFSDRAFDGWFRAQRPRHLPEAAGFYGFGAYGERRTVYATDQFADRASPERRTRHLGIDVFAPSGTPLYAPLAGRVAFVAYNADPLDYGHTLVLQHEAGGTPFWTLYGHLGASLPHLLRVGDPVEAGQLIAHLGDWGENGGWAPHVHFQVMTDLLAQRGGNFFGVGHDSLWDVWSGICIDPNLILRLPPESFAVDPQGEDALMARRAGRLGPSLSVAYRDKLKIVRGRGAWLYDHTGRAFLDAVNNISHVGHCHPHVTEAMARQAATLNTNSRYLSELILDLGDRITARLPEGLSVAYFVNSGTEAN